MKVTLLGTGTSGGVPRVGNDWGECDPEEPRNRRSRVSILVETDEGANILVDTSPDLRTQLLTNDIDRIDAIIWTHDHADHAHGIDDVRPMHHRQRMAIPGYGRRYTLDNLYRRFDYVFAGGHGYPPIVEARELADSEAIYDCLVRSVDQPHGPVLSTGLRFDGAGASLVYATDLSEITDAMVALYSDCDLLIVDCLRESPHPTHAHLDMSLDLARQCHARRVILTHMDKSLDYRSLNERLPDYVEPGYDGFTIGL